MAIESEDYLNAINAVGEITRQSVSHPIILASHTAGNLRALIALEVDFQLLRRDPKLDQVEQLERIKGKFTQGIEAGLEGQDGQYYPIEVSLHEGEIDLLSTGLIRKYHGSYDPKVKTYLQDLISDLNSAFTESSGLTSQVYEAFIFDEYYTNNEKKI